MPGALSVLHVSLPSLQSSGGKRSHSFCTSGKETAQGHAASGWESLTLKSGLSDPHTCKGGTERLTAPHPPPAGVINPALRTLILQKEAWAEAAVPVTTRSSHVSKLRNLQEVCPGKSECERTYVRVHVCTRVCVQGGADQAWRMGPSQGLPSPPVPMMQPPWPEGLWGGHPRAPRAGSHGPHGLCPPGASQSRRGLDNASCKNKGLLQRGNESGGPGGQFRFLPG